MSLTGPAFASAGAPPVRCSSCAPLSGMAVRDNSEDAAEVVSFAVGMPVVGPPTWRAEADAAAARISAERIAILLGSRALYGPCGPPILTQKTKTGRNFHGNGVSNVYGSLCAQFDYEFILVTFMTTKGRRRKKGGRQEESRNSRGDQKQTPLDGQGSSGQEVREEPGHGSDCAQQGRRI